LAKGYPFAVLANRKAYRYRIMGSAEKAAFSAIWRSHKQERRRCGLGWLIQKKAVGCYDGMTVNIHTPRRLVAVIFSGWVMTAGGYT